MRDLRRCILLLLSFAFAVSAWAQTETDLAIAAAFYPPELDADFRANHRPSVPITRLMTPLRLDVDGTGVENYLAVAYSNGLAGAFRLIKGTTLTNAVLVGESPDRTMGGDGHPALDPVDIDNDGVPEMVVTFTRATWIFKYANGALSLYGPTRMGPIGLTSNLGDATFADLEGDGVLEILEVADVSSPDPYLVHALGPDGAFHERSTAVAFTDRLEPGPASGVPPEGSPEEVPEQVLKRSFAATPGTYTLELVNGDQADQHRATTLFITLNGISIFEAGDASAERQISIPAPLLAQNTLEIRSSAGAVISFSILH